MGILKPPKMNKTTMEIMAKVVSFSFIALWQLNKEQEVFVINTKFFPVPPLEFIEETVILGEDIINPDNRIELTLTNTDNPSSILSTEAPPETPPTEPVIVLAEPENEAPPTAEDSKLYRLVQRFKG